MAGIGTTTDAAGTTIIGCEIGDPWWTLSTIDPTPTSTQPAYTGPTGFHVVALKCDNHCDDALEIVPSGSDDCESIAHHQRDWWVSKAIPQTPESPEHRLIELRK